MITARKVWADRATDDDFNVDGENDFTTQLSKWGLDISEYERVVAERLSELLQTMLMITKTGGGMYRDL